jgi:nucleoside-diphosphate-sugar epimerase
VSVALVTGATGLVGSHLVERLLADGWVVRALARDARAADTQFASRVDVVAGDVLDEGSFLRAAQGVDTIFHAAANVLSRGGYDAYRVTNVEGTRNAITAAERANARLLHVSSVAVYGPAARYDAARRGEKTHEDTVLAPLRPGAYYARSKRESEELVLRAHTQGRIWGTAVRPDVVYGRGDRQFVPRMATLIQRAAIPLLHGGRSTMAIVHAANVADGALRAATTDVAGGRVYNLANDFDVTVRLFFELAGEGLGHHPRFIPMPIWLARGVLKAARLTMRAVTGGKFNLVGSSALDFISLDNPFSSDRAKRELGWSPSLRPQLGVPDAFRWWNETRMQKGRDVSSRPVTNLH